MDKPTKKPAKKSPKEPPTKPPTKAQVEKKAVQSKQAVTLKASQMNALAKNIRDTGVDLCGEEVPPIAAEDLKFLLLHLDGLEQWRAYQQSRDTVVTDVGARVCAARIMNKPEVQKWLQIMRLSGAAIGSMTVTSHLSELNRLKQMAENKGDIRTAVYCEELRAKAAGLHVAKDPNVRCREDDIKNIEQALGHFGMSVALQMCAQLGYRVEDVPLLKEHQARTINGEQDTDEAELRPSLRVVE